MSDKNNTPGSGVSSPNNDISPLAPSLENVGITTNIVTGKQPDGTEIVELNANADKAKAFIWDRDGDIIKVPDKPESEKPNIPGLPPLSKVIVETVDGSKLYYIVDGCYLDLRPYVKFSDFNPKEYINKTDLDLYTPKTIFEEMIKRCVSIESFQKKFVEYYDSYEIDKMVKELKDRVNQFPLNAYSKSEIHILLDNIDKYTRTEVDTKIGKIMNLITKNNNDWENSINELASLEFVRNQLTGFLTQEEFDTFKSSSTNEHESLKNRLSNFVTTSVYNRDLSTKVDVSTLDNLKRDLVTNTALNITLDNYVTEEALSNQLSGYLTQSSLLDNVKDFITINEVRNEIINKAEKSEIANLSSLIENKYSEVNSKFSDYVNNTQLNESLNDYLTTLEFNREKISINELFKKYETIEKVDEKIQILKEQLENLLRSYVTLDSYNSEKEGFATKILLQTEVSRLESDLSNKLDATELANKIKEVTDSINSKLLTYATDSEVESKINDLKVILDDKYTKAEVNQKLGDINKTIQDSVNSITGDMYSKSTIDSRFNEKLDKSTLNTKLEELKTELDVDNKLSTKLNTNEFNSTMRDYTTTVELNSKLATKLEQPALDSAISRIENDFDSKINDTKTLITQIDSKITTVDDNLKRKINEEVVNREAKDQEHKSAIDNINNQLSNFVNESTVNDKINTEKQLLDAKITNLENTLTPKITSNKSEIDSIKSELSGKLNTSDIAFIKDEINDSISAKEVSLLEEIDKVDQKLPNYLTKEAFNIETVNFPTIAKISEIEDSIRNNVDSLNTKINTNKDNITSLSNTKLDKSIFDDYTRNVFTKAEVLEKIIPVNDVFKKQEMNSLLDAIKASISGNTTKITEITTEVNNRYNNQRIDNMINAVRNSLNDSNINLSRRIDEKVSSNDYDTTIARINNTLNNKVDLTTLFSAINSNNSRYKTSLEVDTQFETFKTDFWNDIILNFTNTTDMNRKFDLYASLEYLRTELSKYTTLEKLEEKILDINSISRSDVIQMISDSEGNITSEYKRWINNLLATYTTTQTLRTLLNEKVSVSDFSTKMQEIQNTYLAIEDYDRDKANFITTNNIYGIIDNKVGALLPGYYQKTEVDDLLKGIKNLIISNSNLFYSKDIMDEKLLTLETKSDATIKKSMLDTSINELRDRFNSYPTNDDVDAKLNAIGAYTQGITMDSFYNKSQMDGFLLLKANVDTLSTLDRNVYKKNEMDTILNDYVKKANYTVAISNITDNLSNVMRNPVLALTSTDIVLNNNLSTTLSEYQRKDTLNNDVTGIINSALSNYSDNDTLDIKLSNFKTTLTDLDGLINYVKKSDFNTFKSNIYEKPHIDGLERKFVDYTTTDILESKLNAIKSTIKTDQEIINLVQSAGGKNYTKEEINNLLEEKYNKSDLQPLLENLDSKYDLRYISSTKAEQDYVKKIDFSTKLDSYLHLTHGGVVAGATTFNGGATIKNLIAENIDMSSTDIINLRNLTSAGLGTFVSIKATGDSDFKNMSVDNITNLKVVNIRNDGRLSLPSINFDNRKDFDTLSYSDYNNISNTISLITKDNSSDVILNLGLKPGGHLSNKFIKFNTDGSISTRNIRNNDFEAGWITTALKSDVTSLEEKINTTFLKSSIFNSTMNNYYTKSIIDSRLSSIYDKPAIDEKIRALNNQINTLSNNASLQELLDAKANVTDLSQLRLDFNQEKVNRYSKTELNDVWKPQFINELNENFSKSYISTATFNSKTSEFITNTNLQPILTQHGIDIMTNISSNYVTLNTLENKMKLFYGKEDIDSRINLLVSRSHLDNALEAYTKTEDLNLIHQGFNTQIDTANKTASSAKVNLDQFKDVVSTNYFNKSDTQQAINTTVNEVMRNYATKQELASEKQVLETTITNNKQTLESSLSSTRSQLETKDQEIESKVEANRVKFGEYITTVDHTSSVNNERSISDSKYFTKTDAAGLIQKSYVDQQDNLKANKSGDTFTGRMVFNNVSIFNGDVNLSRAGSSQYLKTPRLLISQIRVLENNTNYPIDGDSGIITLSKIGTEELGVLFGNSGRRTSSEPVGFSLSYNGTDLRFSKLIEGTSGNSKYYYPSGDYTVVASTEYVNTRFESIRNVDIPTLKRNLENKLNAELGNLVSNSTISTMNTTLQDLKTTVERDYLKTSKFNDLYTPKETALKSFISTNYISTNTINSNYYTKSQVDNLVSTLRNEIRQAVANFNTTELERRLMAAVEQKINSKIGDINAVLDAILGK